MKSDAPPDPALWVSPPVREVVSVRLMPDLKRALDEFVVSLQEDGWRGLQKHHVVEHLLRDLLTEEGREKVRRELAEARRK